MSFPSVREDLHLPAPRQKLEMGIQGFGHARCSAAEIAGLRKTIPRWGATDTQAHFFKYSDEQTILAVRALDSLIEGHGIDVQELADCAVIAAPQFLGRVQGASAFARFLNGGAQGISPHLIPQHSLHSVSGAISVLIGCHGPNLGVGGGPHAMEDALLTAATLLESGNAKSTLLVCTAWDPAPLPNREGQCTNEPICHAFALALHHAGAAADCGTIQLHLQDAASHSAGEPASTTVTQVVEEMTAAEKFMLPRRLVWNLNWGATAELRLVPRVALGLRAA
ncbi:MAG: hypothetical protein K8R36_24835 [Planctomycetales bacterium]|nr:hypothetical protein [Planctomycetales bacterium]